MPTNKHNLLLNRTFQYLGIILVMAAIGGGYWYWKNAQAGVVLNKVTPSQPVFDAASSSNNGQFYPATYSWTHTTGTGDNRLLIVNVAGDVSSITYGGLGLTRLSNVNYGAAYSQMWYLVGPPSGSATVQVTLTGTACSAAGAMTFSGVDQDRPFGTASTNGNSGGGISVTVSSASDELVVDAIAQYVTTPTQNGSQTLRYSERNGNGSCAMLSAGSTKTGSASTTMQWTEPSGYYSALVAVPIKGVSKDFRIQSSFQDTLEQGLVGYWKLDDASGTSAADASGNGNTGTLTNGPTWTAGQIGGAVNFDGTDDRIQLADSVVFDFGGKGSWCNWFYTTTSQSTKFLFSQDVSSGRSNSTYKWGNYLTSSSGTLATYVRIGGTSYAAVGTAFPSGYYNGGWHHVCGTFDRSLASNRLKLYVDGVLSGSSNAADGDVDSGDWPTIGIWDTVGFQGSIDEVRLYGRTLSAEEIVKLYDQTAPDNPDTGLVGYWPFDGNDISGTTAYDRSGKGNNGTINGSVVTAGIAGQALSFNGSSDYVSIPDSAPLSPTAQMTVSIWINRTENVYLNDRDIISKSQSGSRSWGTNARADGGFNFYIANALTDTGSNYASTGANIIQQGMWTHLMFVFDGSGSGNADRAKIYVNGVQQALTFTGTINSSLQDSVGPVVIGDNEYGGYHRMKGYVDEPRIYNRALSASEIWSLYQSGKPDEVNTGASQADPLEKGLVGYWKLDDASGTNATDSSGNSNTGTLTNGPTWTTGRIGGATDFDGTDDYITASHNAVLNAYPITVSGWIQTSTVDAGTTSRGMVGKYRSGSGDGYLIYLYQGHARAWYFRNSSNYVYDGAQGLDGGFVSDGIWHNVVLKVDASGGELYVDGVKKDSRTWTGTPGAMAATQPFCIGMFSTTADCTAGTFYSGKTDEVRIYNRALSVDEISRLYKQTAPDNPDTGLVGYWPFNGPDVSGTTAYDRSGKGNNGTLTNGPRVIPGKAGQGLIFDGSDDRISYGNISTLKPSFPFTIMAWVKGTGGAVFSNGKGEYFCSPATPYADNYSGIVFYMNGGVAGGNTAGQSSSNRFERAASVSAADGQWHHIAAVLQAGNNINLYKDGVLNNGSYDDGTATTIAYDTRPVLVGAAYGCGYMYHANGTIDEVRIYNRVLTAAEITAIYNAGR